MSFEVTSPPPTELLIPPDTFRTGDKSPVRTNDDYSSLRELDRIGPTNFNYTLAALREQYGGNGTSTSDCQYMNPYLQLTSGGQPITDVQATAPGAVSQSEKVSGRNAPASPGNPPAPGSKSEGDRTPEASPAPSLAGGDRTPGAAPAPELRPGGDGNPIPAPAPESIVATPLYFNIQYMLANVLTALDYYSPGAGDRAFAQAGGGNNANTAGKGVKYWDSTSAS